MITPTAEDADLVHLPGSRGVAETVERLKGIVAEKKLTLFADIDHAAGARAAGMELRPTHLLVFGNARGGTPLMQSQQTIGLDLPLRLLVWEDVEGKVWLTWYPPSALARRHGVVDRDAVAHALDDAIAGLAAAAAR